MAKSGGGQQAHTLLQALSEPELAEPCLVVEAVDPCKILLANPAWCALTGYASDEVVGRSIGVLHGGSAEQQQPRRVRFGLAGLCFGRAGL